MSTAPCPLYTTFASVKVRLTGKVQFQQNPEQVMQGELPDALLAQLISDAETVIEQRLRGRYAIPFQSINNGAFCNLPDHSQRALRRAVDLQATIEVLRTDFGRGSHVSGENYFKSTTDELKKYIDELLGRDPEAANDKRDRYRFTPPLEGVLLSPQNREADDGFKGMLINSDANHNEAESYAQGQINAPQRSYVNRRGWGQL